MTVRCLYLGTGSELGKGYLQKCKYPHAANKETLWEIALHLAFVLLFPLSTRARFHASIFVRVVNTVLGQLCLLLLPKKYSLPQDN